MNYFKATQFKSKYTKPCIYFSFAAFLSIPPSSLGIYSEGEEDPPPLGWSLIANVLTGR